MGGTICYHQQRIFCGLVIVCWVGTVFSQGYDQRWCNRQSECSERQTCINHKCVDACSHSCGANSLCQIENHHAKCFCKKGYEGDPEAGCTLTSDSTYQPPPSPPPPSGSSKKLYFVIPTRSTWYEADYKCQGERSRLASVTTVEEQKHFQEAVRRHSNGKMLDYWTSGTDEETEGQWRWTTSDKPFDMNLINWGEGQPNNKNNIENCLAMWGDTHFYDLPCNSLFFPVCEFIQP